LLSDIEQKRYAHTLYSTFVNKIFFMCEDLAGEENALGRFLKEEGKSDKTR
jgi:hypothetical protein